MFQQSFLSEARKQAIKPKPKPNQPTNEPASPPARDLNPKLRFKTHLADLEASNNPNTTNFLTVAGLIPSIYKHSNSMFTFGKKWFLVIPISV